jgi:hypothetical protein
MDNRFYSEKAHKSSVEYLDKQILLTGNLSDSILISESLSDIRNYFYNTNDNNVQIMHEESDPNDENDAQSTHEESDPNGKFI